MVLAVVVHRHTLFLPLTLGIVAWAKQLLTGALKALSPKLALLVLKNGAVIKVRDLVVGGTTHFFVMSHTPWRRRLLLAKAGAIACLAGAGRGTLRRWLALPLWLRCAGAALVLLATASSAWAVLALLIVPQPVVEFLKAKALGFLNKLGVLRGLDVLWRRAVPAPLQARFDRWRKWTLGRRQLRASRDVRARVKAATVARLRRAEPPTDDP